MALTDRDKIQVELLRREFVKICKDPVKLRKSIRKFCEMFLTDRQQRPLRLTPMQYDIVVHCLTDRNVMLLAPRGSGKSYALGVAITMWLFYHPNGENAFIISPGDAQSEVIFKYVLNNFMNHPTLMSMVDGIRERNNPELRLKYESVLRPRAVAPTNKGKGVRGQHATYMIVDESSYIDDELFVDNVEPCVVRHQAPFINIGTPNDKDNHTWRYMYDENYTHFTRLKYDYKTAMEKGEAYEPCYDIREITIKLRTWGINSMKFRKEYLCEFIDSEGTLFTEMELDPLYNKVYCNYDFFDINFWPELSGECFASVDIGRQINSTVIAIFQKWVDDDGVPRARLLYCEEWIPKGHGFEFPWQRKRIFEICQATKCSGLVVDATGMGLGQLDDIVAEASNFGIPVHAFKFSSKKGEHYEFYKQMIHSERLRMPNYKFLIKTGSHNADIMEKAIVQHRIMTYEMSKDQKTVIVRCPKDAHDDFPDAFVMFANTFMEPVAAIGYLKSVRREKALNQKIEKFKGLSDEISIRSRRNNFDLKKGYSW